MSYPRSHIHDIADTVIDYYRNGNSMEQCAQEFGCSGSAVGRLLIKCNVPRRATSENSSLYWTPQRRAEKSEWAKEKWNDPNSYCRQPEFIQSRVRYGENSNLYGVHSFGKANSMYGRCGEKSPFYGKPRPDSFRCAVRKAKLERIANGETAWNKGLTKITDERVRRISVQLKERYADPDFVFNSDEHRDKMDKIFWSFVLSRKLSNYNKFEQRIHDVLDSVAPNVYSYNGACNSGFRVGRHAPDFVDIDGGRIVEANGCYWHCCPVCNVEHTRFGNADEVRGRDLRYVAEAEATGLSVLIIWQHELRDMPRLLEKVVSFHEM